MRPTSCEKCKQEFFRHPLWHLRVIIAGLLGGSSIARSALDARLTQFHLSHV